MTIQWRIQDFLLEKPTFYVVPTSSNKLRSEEYFDLRGLDQEGWVGAVPKSYQCNNHPQRSCGKVMFLHLSVILFTKGVYVQEGSLSRGVSVQGISVQRGLCPGGLWSRESLSREVSVQGISVLGVSVRETPHTVTCGWYTSNWNAFLLY